MTKAKKTRFAKVKRMISPKDSRQSVSKEGVTKKAEAEKAKTHQVAPLPTSLFLSHNEALAPPYRILLDTNFIHLSLQNRIDIEKGFMDCLYAKCTPCISDCVIAELEKLGHKYRLALRVAKDPRFERVPCSHKGTYADDCITQRVTAHRCFLVATCDRALRRRLRKIPGVPLLNINKKKQFEVERLPDQGMRA